MDKYSAPAAARLRHISLELSKNGAVRYSLVCLSNLPACMRGFLQRQGGSRVFLRVRDNGPEIYSDVKPSPGWFAQWRTAPAAVALYNERQHAAAGLSRISAAADARISKDRLKNRWLYVRPMDWTCSQSRETGPASVVEMTRKFPERCTALSAGSSIPARCRFLISTAA